MEGRIDINGLDLIGLVSLAKKRTRKYTAIALGDIDQLDLTEDQRQAVRKIILDNMNELKRTILRDILGGDVEGSTVY